MVSCEKAKEGNEARQVMNKTDENDLNSFIGYKPYVSCSIRVPVVDRVQTTFLKSVIYAFAFMGLVQKLWVKI
jgi:hypothetical protein